MCIKCDPKRDSMTFWYRNANMHWDLVDAYKRYAEEAMQFADDIRRELEMCDCTDFTEDDASSYYNEADSA